MSVKIKRAMRIARIGRHPGSAQAMLDFLPAEIIASLSAGRLAVILDTLWAASEAAKSIAARQAINEGAIWCSRTKKFRELA